MLLSRFELRRTSTATHLTFVFGKYCNTANNFSSSQPRRPIFRASLSTMAPLKSWLPIPPKSDFSLVNIPFGIITSRNSQKQLRPATAIGDHVLDLLAFSKGDGFSKLPAITEHLSVFEQPTLNAFAALGRPIHREVRKYLQDVFSESTSHPEILKDNEELRSAALLQKQDTKTHLPMQIGDYSDFFAGRNHAVNLGYVPSFFISSLLFSSSRFRFKERNLTKI